MLTATELASHPPSGWREELANHHATNRTAPHAVDTLITRATDWTQTWMSVVTNPRATGQQVRDARDLHRRLGEVLHQIARLALRDHGVVERIADRDVRAAVQTITERLKKEGNHHDNHQD